MTSNEIRSINRLAQRLAVRIDLTFRLDGKLCDDLALYRQFRRDHGEQLDKDCQASVEGALSRLNDRTHMNHAALVVTPFNGKPVLEIEPEIKLGTVKPPNGNGAEPYLNF